MSDLVFARNCSVARMLPGEASWCRNSGADNGTNRANCDTSTKFGTNVLWGLLVKSARGAEGPLENPRWRPFFQDGRHFQYNFFF